MKTNDATQLAKLCAGRVGSLIFLLYEDAEERNSDDSWRNGRKNGTKGFMVKWNP